MMNRDFAKKLLSLNINETTVDFDSDRVWKRSSDVTFKHIGGKVRVDEIQSAAYGDSCGIREFSSESGEFRAVVCHYGSCNYGVKLFRKDTRIETFGPFQGDMGSPGWVATEVAKAVIKTAEIRHHWLSNNIPSAE